MKPGQNDIFRFVSVRGPESVYTAEPTNDLPDLDVVTRLQRVDVDLANPDPKIAGLLDAIPVLNAGALGATSLAAALQDMDAAGATTAASLVELQLTLPDGQTPSLLDYAESATFVRDYRDVANSWLALVLTDPGSTDLPEHETLLRVAHLVRSASRNPALVGQPNAVLRLRSARVLPPATWLEPGRSAEELRARHEAVLPIFHNRQRRHSALGYRTPIEYEFAPKTNPSTLSVSHRGWSPNGRSGQDVTYPCSRPFSGR